jgi:hypothetical protein
VEAGSPSASISQEAQLASVDGLAEALYRSFYLRAVAAKVGSIAIGAEPWLVDVLRDEYGIPFEPLGPCLESSGRSLLPAGGWLTDLQRGVLQRNPTFAHYLGIRTGV